MSEKQLLKGAFILTLAGLFSKVLSASYRVPLQNMAGDEAIYIYQQIYPFIMIAWMLSLYGFPAAISKVTEQRDTGKIILSVPMLAVIGIINIFIFSVIFFGAEFLANWMGDPKLTRLIQYAAWIFLIIPFTSLLRGGFQSIQDMRPTAVSQTLEQVIRVGFILIFTYTFMKHGKSLYDIGAGAVFASILAVLSGLFILLLFTSGFRKRIELSTETVSLRLMGKALVTSSIIVSLNYMMIIFFQLVDNFTMIPALLESGLYMEEAKLEKGIFDRGQPIVQVGIVFASSLSLALFPAIHNLKDKSQQKQIFSVLRLTVILSLAAAVGLMLVLPSLNIALFQTPQGNVALTIFMLMVIMISIALTLSTYLQGLGFMKRQCLLFGLALVVKWILNRSLIPLYGINGAAVSSVVAGFVLVIAFGWIVKRKTGISYVKTIPIKALFISIIGMIGAVLLTKWSFITFFELNNRISHLCLTIISSGVGVIVFFILMLWTKGFTKAEIEAIPFGDKMIKMLNYGWRNRI